MLQHPEAALINLLAVATLPVRLGAILEDGAVTGRRDVLLAQALQVLNPGGAAGREDGRTGPLTASASSWRDSSIVAKVTIQAAICSKPGVRCHIRLQASPSDAPGILGRAQVLHSRADGRHGAGAVAAGFAGIAGVPAHDVEHVAEVQVDGSHPHSHSPSPGARKFPVEQAASSPESRARTS